MERKEYQVAIEHFTALTDHAPEFAQGWAERAAAYYNAGLYGPAVADLEQALALNPAHFEAIAGLAVIFEALSKPAEAYAAYTQVLGLHPYHPQATEARARLAPLVLGRSL